MRTFLLWRVCLRGHSSPYLIPSAVLTNFHKLWALTQQKFIAPQFWRLEVWKWGVSWVGPSGGPGGESVSCFCRNFLGCRQGWALSDWKHIIPISASVIIRQFFPSVSVSVRKFPSYRDTSHGVRPLPSPAWPHLSLITSVNSLFSNRITSTGTRGRVSTYLFGGCSPTLNAFRVF